MDRHFMELTLYSAYSLWGELDFLRSLLVLRAKGLTPGGGVLGISRAGYDRMEPKVKTQNNP